MGGTFMSLPPEYRDYFVRNLHDALSGHSSVNVEEAVRWEGGGQVGWSGVVWQAKGRGQHWRSFKSAGEWLVGNRPALLFFLLPLRALVPASQVPCFPSLSLSPPPWPDPSRHEQVQRAIAHQVHWADHRDSARLLPVSPPHPDALLRLHPPGDWAAVGGEPACAPGSPALLCKWAGRTHEWAHAGIRPTLIAV